MDGQVGSADGKYGTKKADKDSKASITPSTGVFELGECVLDIGARTHDPEYNDEGEETEDMEDKRDAFHQWKFLDKERVPHD